jgi:hypothetical protein
MFLQKQGKDKFCKETKEKYLQEQQRPNQFMEEYFLAVDDTRENAKNVRKAKTTKMKTTSTRTNKLKSLRKV